MQLDLFDLLILFHSHILAFTADIERMYLCVLLHPEDHPWQSILWWEKPTSPVKKFELHTVTYGTKPASFVATTYLKVLGNTVKIPVVSEAIKSHIYMDDLLTRAPPLKKPFCCKKKSMKCCNPQNLCFGSTSEFHPCINKNSSKLGGN